MSIQRRFSSPRSRATVGAHITTKCTSASRHRIRHSKSTVFSGELGLPSRSREQSHAPSGLRRAGFAVCLIAAALAACDGASSQEPKGARMLMIVAGTARTASGSVVPGTTVRITPVLPAGAPQIHIGACSGVQGQIYDVVTDGSGRYVAKLEGSGPISQLCVAVQAIDRGSGAVIGTATRDSVPWAPVGSAEAADTVRIDVSVGST